MIQRGMRKKPHRNQSIARSNAQNWAFYPLFREANGFDSPIGRLFVLGFVLHFLTIPQPVQALELSYGGRLASPSGEPLAGPLDLTFRFYRDASGGTALATVPVPSVPLLDGVFQTSLNLSAEDLSRLFEYGDKTVFVEVETEGKVYPRQKFSYVPLALRVPVDGSKLVYDSEGRLTINSGALSSSAILPGATGTGGLEKVGDQTYRTYALSRAGKDLVGAEDVAAQRSLLGLENLTDVLNSKLSISGGSMAGAINMGGSHKITNLADPTASGDAAKKSYVDGKLGGQPLVVGTPSPGQVIKWDGSKFALATDEMGVAGGGIASLNGLTSGSQSLAVETPGVTSGTRPAWTADSGTTTHTLTIPLASASGVTAGLLSKTDYDLFSGKQSTITPSSALETGSMTTNLQKALEIKPYGSNAGQTGEMHFRELTASGVNYVGLKAPDTLATNTIWTLPVGDGPSGHVLSTDGSGTLSWISPSSGSVTSIVPGTGLTGGPISSAGTISLANVGTAGTYTKVTTNAQGQVVNGAGLADTDIPNLPATKITSGTLPVAQGGTGASTAQPFFVLAGPGVGPTAGAPSFRTLVPADIPSLDAAKITSGTLSDSLINWAAAPVTTVAGRTGAVTLSSTDISGLGSLATVNAVSGGGGGTITDDSITNADINSAAAIADTKLATIATVGKVANSATTATSAGTANAIVARDGSGNFTAGTITASLNGNATNVTGTVALANGGTGATTAASARTNLGAAASGANSDITSLTSLSSLTTTGNVGIGSSTPGFRLDVAISGAGLQTAERLQNTVTAANNSGTQIMYSANRTTSGLTDVAAVGGMITDISASAYKGALVFSTANNAVPTERMRIDASGNVGIGTTVPAAKLDVDGSIVIPGFESGGTSVLSFRRGFPNANNVGIRTKAIATANYDGMEIVGHNGIDFTVNGGTVVAQRISTNGNVGIGTISPTQTLDVNGGIRSLGNGSLPSQVNYGVVWAGGYASPDAGRFFIGDGSGWKLNFSKRVGGTTTDLVAFTDNGNVGIGTTAPAALLDVNSTVNGEVGTWLRNLSNGTNAYTILRVGNDAATNKLVLFSNSSTRTIDGGAGNSTIRTDSGNLHLSAAGGQKVTTQTDGNVGIGTQNPGSKLQIYNSLGGGGAGRFILHVIGADVGDLNYYPLVLSHGAGNVFWISAAGNGWMQGTLSQASDERLKTNIVTTSHGLADVLKMRGVNYQWKAPERGDHLELGLIAQEVEKIIPEVVRTNSDGFKSIAYSNLIPLLVEAIKDLKREKDQEMDNMVKAHRAELQQLKAENQEIRAKLDLLMQHLAPMSD